MKYYNVYYKTNRGPLKGKRISVPVEARGIEDAKTRFERVTDIIRRVDEGYVAEILMVTEK